MSRKSQRHPLHDAFVGFYDERAPGYDTEPLRWHNRLASDLVQYAVSVLPKTLKSPAKVLDLCCGTGLVSFAALEILGPETTVHGVDISMVSLNIAKKKAVDAKTINMEFFYSSVADIESLPLEKSSYSLITCCSALVLLPDNLPSILRRWAEYLQPGGVLIFDVPAADEKRVTSMLSGAVATYGIATVDQSWIKSEADVKDLILEAGLDCNSVFVTENYGTTVIKTDEAEEKWKKSTQKGGIYNTMSLTIEQEEGAKQLFIKKMKEAGGADGVFNEEIKLYIGIGIKR